MKSTSESRCPLIRLRTSSSASEIYVRSSAVDYVQDASPTTDGSPTSRIVVGGQISKILGTARDVIAQLWPVPEAPSERPHLLVTQQHPALLAALNLVGLDVADFVSQSVLVESEELASLTSALDQTEYVVSLLAADDVRLLALGSASERAGVAVRFRERYASATKASPLTQALLDASRLLVAYREQLTTGS